MILFELHRIIFLITIFEGERGFLRQKKIPKISLSLIVFFVELERLSEKKSCGHSFRDSSAL